MSKQIEVRLLLRNGFLDPFMVNSMRTCGVSIVCVQWKRCIVLEVVIAGDIDSIEQYMKTIEANQISHWQWQKEFLS